MERKITFGKYRGYDIKYIILTHIGYIMWVLENITWFRLNDEEQKLYDAIAIAVKKYDVRTSFPVDRLFDHIKDTEDFNNLYTPVIIKNGNMIFIRDDSSSIRRSVDKYVIGKPEYNNNVEETIHLLAHEMAKMETKYIMRYL